MKFKICTLIAVIVLSIQLDAQNNMIINLNDKWSFRKVGDTTNWIPATVPGCVHTDLMNANIIPDPFYGTNESKVQWVENEDWEYQTFFQIKNKFLKHDFITLHFEGLDTYADVYLNDSLILQSENMFVAHQIDVKHLLLRDVNKLYIRFYSPVKKAKADQQQYIAQLPGEERVFVRKAQYQFGWDWGPRLVTSGIWKNVYLKAEDHLKVTQSKINFIDNGSDTVLVNIDLLMLAQDKTDYKIELSELNSKTVLYSKAFENHFATTQQMSVPFPVSERWLPNGFGKQTLYRFKLTIISKNKIIYENTITTGFSNIKLIQEKDQYGESFYFTVNGENIFAKGANLIPIHSFSPAATRDYYRNLLMEAKNMNMNMIRIWGGGIYESDYLYDLCDSLGIMVWQDFMFACAMYPNNPKWETEFSQQVNRLKYHPSIALWCGNNENDEGWKNWGWQKQYKYTDSQAAYIQQTNEQLFKKVIPEILFTETQNVQNYHSSSPLHGWGRKESMYEGDSHYWGVWWGKQPFTVFNEKVPRFMSEYGFQGMPVMNSFKQFIPSDELMLGSPSVKQHQKHPVGYETIAEYMAREYQIPVSFEDYIYVSQLLQAGGMRTAIEAHRRNMPYCMGTLFWQLNDCWPVTSWSVIDYYTNRKASYYAVKKAYADVMISVVQQNGKLETWFVNDGRTTFNAKMYYRLFTTKGKLISEKTLPVTLDAAHSIKYTELEVDYFLEGYSPENCILYVSLLSGDTLLAERYHQFTPAKQVTLQTPEIQLQWDNQRKILTVTSDVYTMGVYLYTDNGELKLSDNFFDLLPSTPKEISLQGILPDNSVSTIKIKSLNTIYKTL